MAEPQPASGGLTDQAALGCCSDPDPSTKVGAEPFSPESRGPAWRIWGPKIEPIPPGSARPGSDWIRIPFDRLCNSVRLGRAEVGWGED